MWSTLDPEPEAIFLFMNLAMPEWNSPKSTTLIPLCKPKKAITRRREPTWHQKKRTPTIAATTVKLCAPFQSSSFFKVNFYSPRLQSIRFLSLLSGSQTDLGPLQFHKFPVPRPWILLSKVVYSQQSYRVCFKVSSPGSSIALGISMLSLSNSALFPVTTSYGISRPARLPKTINLSTYNQKREPRNIFCACMAPPQNLRSDESFAAKFEVTL